MSSDGDDSGLVSVTHDAVNEVMVIAREPELEGAARRLASRFGLTFDEAGNGGSAYQLVLTSERLELRSNLNRQGPVYVDFTGGAVAHRQRFGGGRKQLIARAVGMKKGESPRILDATAGMARDAFVLACLGSEVTLIERSPVIAALLENGLQRAENHIELGELVRERLSLNYGDALDVMRHLVGDKRPDVIFLDPMFPEKAKSALVKKEMRVFRDIAGKDTDADKLLPVALKKALKRVVVKRPLYAGWLNDLKPTMEMKSGKQRFDIYIIQPETRSGIC